MLGSFKISGSNIHSVDRILKKERDPIEIIFCTLFATVLFIYVYYIMGTKFRQDDKVLAFIVGPGLVLLLCLALTGIAIKKKMEPERRLVPQQNRAYSTVPTFDVEVNRKRNLIINLAVCSWGALIAGFFLGDRSYWAYKTEMYSYSDLVSYVDIDPAKDSGTSYMDSGHVYFKENTYVLRNRFAKFHNGDTYCAAPIVNGPFKANGTKKKNVVNGYIIPESGSFDWWAVGTNCCNDKGASSYQCGEINNPLSRSGMRLLSDNQRPFFVLAVQEWSATYGLPVKHPLFFHWVKDPLATEGEDDKDASGEFWTCLGYFMLFTFIVAFLIQMALHKAGIS